MKIAKYRAILSGTETDLEGRVGVVSIAIMQRGSNPGKGEKVFALKNRPDRSGAHKASYSMVLCLVLGGKVAYL